MWIDSRMTFSDKIIQGQLLALAATGRKLEKASADIGNINAEYAYKYMSERVESIARLLARDPLTGDPLYPDSRGPR
jgi:hypothetical protein